MLYWIVVTCFIMAFVLLMVVGSSYLESEKVEFKKRYGYVFVAISSIMIVSLFVLMMGSQVLLDSIPMK